MDGELRADRAGQSAQQRPANLRRARSIRFQLAAQVKGLKSRRVRGAVGRWQMKAWSGAKLLEEFYSMDTDKSNGVDKRELASFLHPLDFGMWEDEELEELFSFLDVDRDGIISVPDFSRAIVAPMQKEQLERAIDAKEIGRELVDSLPVPLLGEDGKMPNALQDAVELPLAEIERLIVLQVPQIAATIHAKLQPHKEALQRATAKEEQAVENAKFTFEFADVGRVEQGALSERLGLPSADVPKAMRDEHCSEREWTTGNYNITTHPKQEFEFVDNPCEGKAYPGEGEGGRRRQIAEDVWRRVHAAVPAREVLKGFKSRLGQLDEEVLCATVQGRLRRHESEQDKNDRFAAELKRALVQGLTPNEEVGLDDLDVLVQRLSASQIQLAAGRGWMSESETRQWVERELAREVRELQERLSAWDLTLAEIKAVMLYTGPMFEHYNRILRTLDSSQDAVKYKTTLLMLISGVMKMRRRTKLGSDRKVFRGLARGELPVPWILEGELGSKGGAEKAFMSTSTKWEQAARYATSGGNPVVIEIQLGQIDKGADIAELSQYPGEAEVLFPPMTNLEVLGMPRLENFDGHGIMVLSVRANVSVRIETREELAAKRKTVFLPSLSNVLSEVQRDLDVVVGQQPASTELFGLRFSMRDAVLGDCRNVLAQYEARPPEWFQVDQHYQVAVQEAAALRRLAVAKFQSLWCSRLPQDEAALHVAASEWESKLLSVVDAEELNKRTRRWEASRSSRSSRASAEREVLRQHALELCEWQGLVDAADVDMSMDLVGNTTLILAAVKGEAWKVELLLDAGSDPDKRNGRFEAPLHKAATEGHADVVSALMDAKADAEARDVEGNTALLIVSKRGFESAAMVLIDRGAVVAINDQAGCTPLIYACRNSMRTLGFKILEKGVDVNTQDIYGRSALIYACDGGLRDVGMRLVNSGAQVNACDVDGRSPLLCACISGLEDVSVKLIEHGAEVNHKDKAGWTPLAVACKHGLSAVVTKLLDGNAMVNVKDPDGCSPLMWAHERGMENVVAQLVEQGAESNAKVIFLEKVEEFWRVHELNVTQHRVADGRTALVLVGVDELFETLEDHLAALKTILASRFAVGVRDRVASWSTTLSKVSDTLHDWLAVQRSWMTLCPFFAGSEISTLFPEEVDRFRRADGAWRQLMRDVQATPKVIEIVSGDERLATLQEAGRELEEVQRTLDGYLGGKRWSFPRFSFLSNDEVFELLNECADPRAVQPFLPKLFEGIWQLDVEGNESDGGFFILAMKDKLGERVQFPKPVQTSTKGVEVWMGDLEHAMRQSLLHVTVDAMAAFRQQQLEEWLASFPAASIELVLQVEWAASVHRATESGQSHVDALGEVLTVCNDQILMMVGRLRADLSPRMRALLVNLVIGRVHCRDMTERLVRDGVSSSASFAWTGQIRFYWVDASPAEKACVVRQGNADFWYGWEFLGLSSRLVVTPVTERCWLTLTGALKLSLGGLPMGPAGTGKTETTKDLAKAIGRQCVVFNCSDGLDVQAMAKFFEGLVQGGAWACFDEFNRIDLEVLSAVALLMSTIQNAIRSGAQQVSLLGKELRVNSNYGCFVTMNPGYAGRSELPDNLMALFRPVAMVVPDLARIAEIMLFSSGFQSSFLLSRKLVQLFQLLAEQLSKQPHYDFGLRAIKSVLVLASLQRKQSEMSEDVTLMRALRDYMLARFVASDVPTFFAVMRDLFPGTILSGTDHALLRLSVERSLEGQGLQAVDQLVTKTLQLHDTSQVRHGVMLIGPTAEGKTTCIATLAKAMTALCENGTNTIFRKVNRWTMNPKSITIGELYGCFNARTREWADGILAAVFRNAASAGGDTKQWIVCDGPVDAIWMENLNTVLDDNKKLCLMSGEIIGMPSTMTMMFEVENVMSASPATISRVGCIFLDVQTVGWLPIAISRTTDLLAKSFPGIVPKVVGLLQAVGETALQFVRRECTEHLRSVDTNLVMSLCNLLASLLREEWGVTHGTVDALLGPLFVFSFVWTFGGNLTDTSRHKFDEFARTLIADLLPDFPIAGTVFDWTVDLASCRFVPWSEVVLDFRFQRSNQNTDFIVPTVDTTRMQHIIRAQIGGGHHILVGGSSGVGKSVILRSCLGEADGLHAVHSKNLSSQTSARALQNMFESKLHRNTESQLGAPPGKSKMIFLIDDLNLPAKEPYGAQPPLELLRQIIYGQDGQNGGFYSTTKLCFQVAQDILFLGACAPPGGGRSVVPARLLRHFHLINIADLSHGSMKKIFLSVVSGFLESFSPEYSPLADFLVEGSLDMFLAVQQTLLPTPSKSHYSFNLRDLAKVVKGILMVDAAHIDSPDQLVRLWCHENARVFRDRLVDNHDRNWFDDKVCHVVRSRFDRSWRVRQCDVLFGDFLSSGLSSYVEVTDMEMAATALRQVAEDFAAIQQTSTEMVFFTDAIHHIGRICRVLRQSGGHALLVGVGGSGRQSLARLATFASGMACSEIDSTQTYDIDIFRQGVKKALKQAGAENRPTVLLLGDRHLPDDSFLAVVSDILIACDVQDLFDGDELPVISDLVLPDSAANGVASARAALWTALQMRCLANLHCLLALSPGNTFRTRIRSFPALVNCCTIDWFTDWPQDALLSVARHCLEPSSMSCEQADALSNVLASVHSVAVAASAAFASEHRTAYVTPKSFLELLKLRADLMAAERRKLDAKVERYREGLGKLTSTNQQVESMKSELENLQDVLARSSEGQAALIRELTAQRATASAMQAAVLALEDQLLQAGTEGSLARVAGGQPPERCADSEDERLVQMRRELEASNERVLKQEEQLHAAEAARENVERQCKAVASRLGRAAELTKSLANEAARWERELYVLGTEAAHLDGHILLAAAHVAYSGPFTTSYRSSLVEQWLAACSVGDLQVRGDFDLQKVLCDGPGVRSWHLQGLPSDKLSTENGIIVTRSNRWPLMIDPQMQAKGWIKAMERGQHLQIVRLSQSSLIRTLENCIHIGRPVLLEDVGESLDPSLEPVLARQVYRSGRRLMMRIRESAFDYDPSFRLYITSKLSNPHYPPKLHAQLTVVNFTVTPLELEEQLLKLVVAHEQPELEEAKNQLVIQIAREQKALEDVEDKILHIVANAQGNILDDEVLLAALRTSSKTTVEIQNQLARAADTKTRIDQACDGYRPAAQRGALLYFATAKLSRVDPMYQYSLQFFLNIFGACLDKSTRCDGVSERVRGMVRVIAEEVFSKVCSGLFEKHKRLFAFLIAMEVLRVEQGVVSDEEWVFFLTKGGSMDEQSSSDESAPDWIRPEDLPGLASLEKVNRMAGLKDSICSNAEAWRSWHESASVSEAALPAPWDATLSVFQKLLVLRVLRHDKASEGMTALVRHVLGKAFVETKPFHLASTYSDSGPLVPILFILSPGADPSHDLCRLAHELGVSEGLETVSLGQGQGPIAEAMVRRARVHGQWAYIQNCHLAPSWFPMLERLLEALLTRETASDHGAQDEASEAKSGFRLWLSSMPISSFPVSVLQAAVKLTFETPRGLRANISRAYQSISKADFAYFDSSQPALRAVRQPSAGRLRPLPPAPLRPLPPSSSRAGPQDVAAPAALKARTWKRLLFALAYFHAAVLERRSFGPIGWNVQYAWNQADWLAATAHLRAHIEEHTVVPFEALRHIIGQIVYGGRVTDEHDLRCMRAMLLRCLSPDVVDSARFQLSDDGCVFVPDGDDLTGTRAVVAELPLVSSAEALGLHRNAEIALGRSESTQLVDALIVLQSNAGSAAPSGSSASLQVGAAVQDIVERLPSPLSTDTVASSVMERDEAGVLHPLSTFLLLEVERFNTLLQTMRCTLADLERGIKGLIIMSADLEDMHHAVLFRRIPSAWSAVGYASLKPLGPWFADLLARIAWVQRWLEQGPPAHFWISGLFFPAGFITAVLQAFARKHGSAVDTLHHRTEVIASADNLVDQHPADGVFVYGLHLEGARWDVESASLVESRLGETHTPMQTIWVEPVTQDEGTASACGASTYCCPVYKVPSRKGALSTTGRSTNFVMDVQLPAGERSPEHWVLRSVALLCQLDH